ncbi:hypothetical protein PFISCL1PPCAC_18431, partial [Pristionchus fissidentatus]
TMSTVVYSYSTGRFALSTLLVFNGQTGQLEPSPLNDRYRNSSSSSLKKWGTLTNLSTLDLPSIIEENSDSGLGSSSDVSLLNSDTESRASPVHYSTDFSSENNSDSDSSDEIESPNTDVQWVSNIINCVFSDYSILLSFLP